MFLEPLVIHFAIGCAPNRGNYYEVSWGLICGKTIPDMLTKCTQSGFMARLRFNHCTNRFSKSRIRKSYCNCITHRHMSLENFLYFFGKHLFSTGVDTDRTPPQ
jgi:hypothetical protein